MIMQLSFVHLLVFCGQEVESIFWDLESSGRLCVRCEGQLLIAGPS